MFLEPKLWLCCTRSDKNMCGRRESVVKLWTLISGSYKLIRAGLWETDREKCSAFDYCFSCLFFYFLRFSYDFYFTFPFLSFTYYSLTFLSAFVIQNSFPILSSFSLFYVSPLFFSIVLPFFPQIRVILLRFIESGTGKSFPLNAEIRVAVLSPGRKQVKFVS
jgi:hypothetical protein